MTWSVASTSLNNRQSHSRKPATQLSSHNTSPTFILFCPQHKGRLSLNLHGSIGSHEIEVCVKNILLFSTQDLEGKEKQT